MPEEYAWIRDELEIGLSGSDYCAARDVFIDERARVSRETPPSDKQSFRQRVQRPPTVRATKYPTLLRVHRTREAVREELVEVGDEADRLLDHRLALLADVTDVVALLVADPVLVR